MSTLFELSRYLETGTGMMAKSVKETLPTMLALAREHTEISRLQLAGMLADVFLNGTTILSLREEEQLNELIDILMANATPAVRTQLLKKFVDVSRMPRRMANSLANETIDVARPILLSARTLDDGDLIRLVNDKGGDHAVTIAMREKVSEAVADALVTTGDMRVMQVVVENLNAHLSPVAMDVVAEAARHAAGLRKPLLMRPEMNTDRALKLYWWVEQDLRRYTLSRFGVSAGQIDEALAKTVAEFLDDHHYVRGDDDVMEQVADWIEQHQALTPQILPQVLRMGHYRLFNMLLARLAKLSLSLVDTIMDEVGGRGLAAIGRAIGVDKPGFVSLFLLSRGGRPGEQIVHPRELSYALEIFDRMTPEVAKDLLHSWSVNPAYLQNHRDNATTGDEIHA